MKYLLTATLVIIRMSLLFAQDFNTNLNKYHHYRNRLLTEFMVTGDGQGMSMPAERRDTSALFMKWADNTIWLGWYAGMLALEYRLLSDSHYYMFNGGDTAAIDKTLDELYYAMRGIVRLDEVAETAFPLPCDSQGNIRNGFFLRDDVDSAFYHHFPGMSAVQSDFTDVNVYAKEMSQDQVYHLLLGLALVKKFIPPSVTVNGMNIRQEAIDQALLILEWVNRDGWIIKNPACQNKDVDRGENVTLLSHGVNEVVKFFSDGAVNYDMDIMPFYTFSWSTLTSPTNIAYDNEDNLHMVLAIAAMGKGWDTTTLPVMMTLAESNRWYAYPMIYAALHDDTIANDFSAMLDTMNFWSGSMLNEAPPEGPYTLYPDSNMHGYAVNNRFIRGRPSHYIGHFFTEGSQFNGLDYMMLHNLYYLLSPSKWELVAPVGINEPETEPFHLYSDFNSVFLRLNPAAQIDKAEVYDLYGKLIRNIHFETTSDIAIPIANMSAGIYFLRVTTESGTWVKRFIRL